LIASRNGGTAITIFCLQYEVCMRRLLVSLSAALVLLAATREARAIPLVTGLGGTNGFGTGCMPPNDDGTWPDNGGLDITAAFPSGLKFYGGTYTSVYINTNGNISFSGALSTFTPNAFPGAPQPMIAPYWADVDTRSTTDSVDSCDQYPGGGSFPMGTVCTNPPPTSNLVQWSIAPGQFVVTWYKVGFFSCHTTPVMSFQLILTAAPSCGGGASPTDFSIEFRYAECGWEAGDASGGANGFCAAGTVASGLCTPAQAGFDPGLPLPDTGYASLPMSLESGISSELCNESNLTPAVPGDWKFNVVGGSIQCPTAGQPCQTGLPGVCADGQVQCTVAGAGGDAGTTSCVPLTPAGPTQCNGLDNNCDGVIDTGPCPTGTVCDGTACVPICIEGGCPTGETCSQGLCIETDCVNVTCPSGQRCVNGACVDACSGIQCPIGQVCRLGNCVDPCANLNCGQGQVCEMGACVPACPCTACTSAQTCETTGAESGHCVATDCATVSCPAGDVCQSGACISACTGAHCPANQTCVTGECVPAAPSDDAGGGGIIIHPLDAGPIDDASFPFDATLSGDDASAPGDQGPTFGTKSSSGCGCSAAGRSGSTGSLAGLGLGLLAMMSVRRRRTKRP
jgi:MYXO-CTERM domain-containing protein